MEEDTWDKCPRHQIWGWPRRESETTHVFWAGGKNTEPLQQGLKRRTPV